MRLGTWGPAVVVARAATIQHLAGLPRQGSRARGWCVFAWRHALSLRAVRHPRGATLRQEVENACIHHHHAGMGWSVRVRTPQTGSPLDPGWRILFGHQLRPLPHPADLMAPAADGFCRDRDAVCGRERGGTGGTSPSRAAPARGPWGFCQYGAQRARAPGHADRGCSSARAGRRACSGGRGARRPGRRPRAGTGSG